MINTQQIIANILHSNMNNPIAQNIMQAYQNKDMNVITDIARNVMKEQGRDFDKEFQTMKNRLGIS